MSKENDDSPQGPVSNTFLLQRIIELEERVRELERDKEYRDEVERGDN